MNSNCNAARSPEDDMQKFYPLQGNNNSCCDDRGDHRRCTKGDILFALLHESVAKIGVDFVLTKII